MKKLVLLGMLALGMTVVGCATSKKVKGNHTISKNMNIEDRVGTYLYNGSGDLIIKVRLTLEKDLSYTMLYLTLEGEDFVTKQKEGTYTWNDATKQVELDQAIEKIKTFQLKEGNLLPILEGKVVAADDSIFERIETNDELTEKYWKLMTINGKSVLNEEFVDREAHFMLKNTFNEVRGNDGCNVFGGEYRIEGNTLKFDKVFSTMMACPGSLSFENFLRVLNSGQLTVEQKGDHLTLKNGKDVLTFDAIYF